MPSTSIHGIYFQELEDVGKVQEQLSKMRSKFDDEDEDKDELWESEVLTDLLKSV
jgi:hypothetical protein